MPSFPSHIGLALVVLVGLTGCVTERAILVDGDAKSSTAIDDRPSPPSARASGPAVGPKTLYPSEAGGVRNQNVARFVEEGTGRLIGEPSPLAGEAPVRDEGGEVTLNVVNADIREVVRLILEDGLGANYVIDPAVTGSVTIRTGQPLPESDVLPLLNSILNANGAALIDKGGLYSIVPREQSLIAGGKPGTRARSNARGVDSGIMVATLRYADAAKLGELLQPFVVNEGSVQLDAERNTLLLTGSADQIGTMSDLIDIFDVDWMRGMSFGFYPLDEAKPDELAFELGQVFGGDDAEETGTELVRFVPVERLNALLVITAQPDYLKRAEAWIDRLDRVGEGNEEQIYVYPVQNGRATDLASVLGELFEIESTVVGPDPLLAPGLEPFELRSSQAPDETEAAFGDDRRRPERKDRIGAVAPFDPRELTEGADDDDTKIVADEGNNALLIKAVPKIYKKIEAALRELDLPPLQILLEATIAEVRLRDELRYGIQWFFNSGSSDFTLSNDRAGRVEPSFPGFSGILSTGDVRLVIDALDEVSDVQVVSSPQLLVLDNQTAQLQVGDEVPIVVQQSQGVDTDDARLINTVELRQTGVILSVTPRVNANGLVVLDILQEVSDVAETNTSNIDSPTIAQRRVATTVAVNTDQTVALGGLIEDDVLKGRAGVPFLSSIPVLGWLFGSIANTTERTELLILITPKVLTDPNAAVAATDEIRRRLRAIAPLEARLGKRFGVPENDQRDVGAKTSERVPEGRYFVVQLASLANEADAIAAWEDYEKVHREALRGLAPRIEPYEVNGRSGVSLRAGPISTYDTADGICTRLQAEGADCLVVEKR